MDSKGVKDKWFVVNPKDFRDLFMNGSKRDPGDVWTSTQTEGLVLNLGCGEFTLPDNPKHFDLQEPEWIAPSLIDFDSRTVATIHAYHFLEHLTGDEVKHMLKECTRVLMVDGVMNICVPYARADIAFQDIDHKTFFTEESWETLLNNPYYDTDMNSIDGELKINFNVIAGVVGRNLSIYTQLEKVA
jgi:hypothetical protein